MAKKTTPRPTDAELAILRVLWDIGPSTVRQVFEHMALDTAYTTVLKTLQIMIEKGLVLRDESERSHVYTAAQPAQQTQRALIKHLVDRAFAGSSSSLVLQALAARRATPEELSEIRRLLDEYQSSANPLNTGGGKL